MNYLQGDLFSKNERELDELSKNLLADDDQVPEI